MPELGWVSPTEFIPIAKNSRLITSIGEWVLRSAVQQMKAWIADGMGPMSVAVNLSAVQFDSKTCLNCCPRCSKRPVWRRSA